MGMTIIEYLLAVGMGVILCYIFGGIRKSYLQRKRYDISMNMQRNELKLRELNLKAKFYKDISKQNHIDGSWELSKIYFDENSKLYWINESLRTELFEIDRKLKD